MWLIIFDFFLTTIKTTYKKPLINFQVFWVSTQNLFIETSKNT